LKLGVYRCDRCGKVFRIDDNFKPDHVVWTDVTGEKWEYDLCSDCIATFQYFLDKPKDFDELAEKIAEKEKEDE